MRSRLCNCENFLISIHLKELFHRFLCLLLRAYALLECMNVVCMYIYYLFIIYLLLRLILNHSEGHFDTTVAHFELFFIQFDISCFLHPRAYRGGFSVKKSCCSSVGDIKKEQLHKISRLAQLPDYFASVIRGF